MSLMRLLTAGKTLIGGNNPGSQYRVTRQRLLPKFGSAEEQKTTGIRDNGTTRREDNGTRGLQDDRTTGRQEHGTTRQRETGRGLPERVAPNEGPEQIESDAERRSPDASRPQGPPGDADASVSWKARATKAVGQGAGVFGKVKALVSRRKAKPADVFGTRATRPAVQGELALERVKVVRNDLSQDDLEVVPAKGRGVGAPAAPASESEDEMIAAGSSQTGRGAGRAEATAETSGAVDRGGQKLT